MHSNCFPLSLRETLIYNDGSSKNLKKYTSDKAHQIFSETTFPFDKKKRNYSPLNFGKEMKMDFGQKDQWKSCFE